MARTPRITPDKANNGPQLRLVSDYDPPFLDPEAAISRIHDRELLERVELGLGSIGTAPALNMSEESGYVIHLFGELEPIDSWADIGAGNPRQRHIEESKHSISTGIAAIEVSYKPSEKLDKDVFRILEGAKIVVATIGEKDAVVKDMISKKLVHSSKRNQKAAKMREGARDYDSLTFLKIALDAAARGEDAVSEFTTSQMAMIAEDPLLTGSVWGIVYSVADLINQFGDVQKTGSRPQPIYARYISHIKEIYMTDVIGYKVPSLPTRNPASSSQRGNFRSRMKELIKFSWQEWESINSGAHIDDNVFKLHPDTVRRLADMGIRLDKSGPKFPDIS